MNNNVYRICDELDWEVYENGDKVQFHKETPAGERFSFWADQDDLAQNVANFADEFNPDDHVENWLKAKAKGVPEIPSVRELIEDADTIKELLKELADALCEAL